MTDYLPIIGIEVHIELRTESKMFCGCSAQHFLVKPNTHTCPVCLGLPGALPVPNKKAIEWCFMLGLALGCQVNEESKFDRKNYFYPDLPKGYQISQYDMPFSVNGKLNLKSQISNLKTTTKNSKLKEIRINRVHLEEDTAKLIHQSEEQRVKSKEQRDKYTLIDFNRSGVPLAEVVSEPDINTSEEAVLYLKKLQQIVRYLGISDADMEKGSMRCEVNISLSKQPATSNQKPAGRKTGNWQLATGNLPNYKVEVKNINSFRFVKKAIEYEIERQRKILLAGKTPIQETRGYSENKGITYSQRSKEEAHDYRYFPEPDIPPFVKLKAKSLKLKAELPELPDEKLERFIRQYAISEYNAKILTAERNTADYFEEAVKVNEKLKIKNEKHTDIKTIGNVIVNKKLDIKKYLPAQLIKMLIKKSQAYTVDEKEIEKVIQQVLAENPKAIADYQKGKTQALGFLIGQVMRKGKFDPGKVKKAILVKINV